MWDCLRPLHLVRTVRCPDRNIGRIWWKNVHCRCSRWKRVMPSFQATCTNYDRNQPSELFYATDCCPYSSSYCAPAFHPQYFPLYNNALPHLSGIHWIKLYEEIKVSVRDMLCEKSERCRHTCFFWHNDYIAEWSRWYEMLRFLSFTVRPVNLRSFVQQR